MKITTDINQNYHSSSHQFLFISNTEESDEGILSQVVFFFKEYLLKYIRRIKLCEMLNKNKYIPTFGNK